MNRVRLLVGTKRGLFTFTSDPGRRSWAALPPDLIGREVYFVGEDRLTGMLWASTTHRIWGAHLFRSGDRGESWQMLESAPQHPDDRALMAIWSIAASNGGVRMLWAGTEPAGLFSSSDDGESWQSVTGLNEHPTVSAWQAAGGALALHSIMVDPRDARRMYCAVSAGGCYRSDDGGTSWRPINRNVRADFLPQRFPDAGQCVHKLVVHPRARARLYQQNHCGVYRSDDAGDSWTEITSNLPSDYGYALATDPANPDTAFVIPEASSHMRTTVAGKLRVYRTDDAGASWVSVSNGLPQENAYQSVLREAMTSDTLEPCGVYFGTSGGHLFASNDRGDHWQMIAGFLPRIIGVSAVLL